MLEVEALALRLGEREVLGPLSFSLPAGGHLLVQGPSGSGKTSLLHLLAGLIEPTTGRRRIGTIDPAGLTVRARDRWRGATVGLVFQASHLVAALSVLDNLRLPGFLARRAANDAGLTDLLALVGLADRARSFPAELSQGERQRASVPDSTDLRPVSMGVIKLSRLMKR